MLRRVAVLLFVACLLSSARADSIKLRFGTTATPQVHNETTAQPDAASSWQGYVGAVIAILLFGSNFVPVKKFETGDGIFFQWVLCTAIWISGLVTNCIQNFPTFYPLAMLGGFLWATGNVCVVPIIKTIGLGLGMLIWGSFNLLSGWASGRFGWFGLDPQTPNNLLYNDLAIAFAMISAVCWVFVKSDVSNTQTSSVLLVKEEDAQPVIQNEDDESVEEEAEVLELSWVDRLSTLQRRVIGCVLSVFSGTLYGLSFTPVIYIKNNYHGASQTDIDYVFAHFCGIFTTSTVYLVIYSIIKKNKPQLYPSIVLPGIVSGAMWAIADIGWFVANNYLSEAVSFPIVTTGPGIVASLWGVIVFREVKGLRNFLIMGFAYTFTITGAILAGFSKA
uniref:Transmembrane protein 144-like n=1 Tax=Phallusia mammillata TaxID=59560 RepID=A0A6F9DUD9_9ASCI|nr:transmembrane protein 144-like [Phallusia mammillata]